MRPYGKAKKNQKTIDFKHSRSVANNTRNFLIHFTLLEILVKPNLPIPNPTFLMGQHQTLF